MCGIAGLSVGCPLESICSNRSWTPAQTAPSTKPSTLERQWDKAASVRSKPRRFVTGEKDSQFFPEHLVPVLNTQAAVELNPEVRHSLATQHLYRYLDFTLLLETLVVNKVLLGIALGRLGFPASRGQRLDAMRMYTDEAYHATAAMDIGFQVEGASQINNMTAGHLEQEFLMRLHKIKEAVGDPQLASLVELSFVIASETLISGNLSDVGGSNVVDEGVRSVITDHAKDEGRHHGFFYRYLKDLWGHLNERERQTVGWAMPQLIHAFFAPEISSVERELTQYGVSASLREELLAEAYSPERIQESARSSSSHIVKYMTDLGSLESPEIEEEFEKHGLLTHAEARSVEGATA